ncbi:hypothetical protein H5410_028823 [Solanum commersonii]|uniref:Uncharacterized protein n=1 Tax=Solanum commersonii TaxID=4109 RepID=A0A9J5Z312_SOLCO|nr:hypothetical protein H5410_028823 [Solanum commersonii]
MRAFAISLQKVHLQDVKVLREASINLEYGLADTLRENCGCEVFENIDSVAKQESYVILQKKIPQSWWIDLPGIVVPVGGGRYPWS